MAKRRFTKTQSKIFVCLNYDGGLSTSEIGERFKAVSSVILRSIKRLGYSTQRPRYFDRECALSMAKQKIAAALYVDGKLSTTRIANRFGLNHATIGNAIRRQGCKIRKQRRVSEQVKKIWYCLYCDGYLTTTEIGDRYDHQPGTVTRAVRNFGGIIRTISAGAGSPFWKGGRIVTANGYVNLWLDKSDPYYCMTGTTEYALEHRVVMARYLNRPLEPHETVHHINGIRDDNRIENLQLRIGAHGAGQVYICKCCGSKDIVPKAL